jgi:hypothetical protein
LLEIERELTHADLAALAGAPNVGVPIVQKLRAIHHRQAALLADGKSVKEVAAIVGCTTARLTQLQNDPSFAELVEFYKDQIITAMLSDSARLRDKIVDVGEMAVDELRDRLEDTEQRKRIHVGEIRKIAEFAMDRTVAPPQAAAPTPQFPPTVTINFGTPIKQQPAEPVVIEGKVEE